MLVSQTYHFEFDHPAEKRWSVIADTARWGIAAVENILRDYYVRERTVSMNGIDTPVSTRQFSASSPA